MSRQPLHLYSIVIALESTDPSTRLDKDDVQNDTRQGDLWIDWVDYHSEKEIQAQQQSYQQQQQSGPSSPTIKLKRLDTDPASVIPFPRPRQTQGTTELGLGVIHLFVHSTPLSLLESFEAQVTTRTTGEGIHEPGQTAQSQEPESRQAEGQDGTLIAILAVPAWMDVTRLAEWLGPWTTCMEGFRIIRWVDSKVYQRGGTTLILACRDKSPNRSLVLLKFNQSQEAHDFVSIYTGKSFSPDQAETCHPVRIHHLVLHSIDQRHQTMSRSSMTALLQDIPPKSVEELPTCPVCLERLDSVVTGLVATPCSHVIDCQCLEKWSSGSDCLACHYAYRPPTSSSWLYHHSTGTPSTRAPTPSKTVSGGSGLKSKCLLCKDAQDESTSNWVCVVCGYIGCSRYQQGHARNHFLASGHSFSMEIDTQRVWDYTHDK